MRSVRKTDHQIRIEEFMLKAEQEVKELPCIPSEEVRRLRAQLILEEALETVQALGFTAYIRAEEEGTYKVDLSRFLPTNQVKEQWEPNLVKIADGCADLSVVTIGTLSACGIADEALLEEVDRSNLDKFRGDAHKAGPDHPQPGRWCKPSDWKPPEIERILAEQGENRIALNADERWTPPAEVYEQNGHGWEEPRAQIDTSLLPSTSNKYGSIEEYRAVMKEAGRFVNDSYNRLCSSCGRVPIHKHNTGGVCPDCISDKSVKEMKK